MCRRVFNVHTSMVCNGVVSFMGEVAGNKFWRFPLNLGLFYAFRGFYNRNGGVEPGKLPYI